MKVRTSKDNEPVLRLTIVITGESLHPVFTRIYFERVKWQCSRLQWTILIVRCHRWFWEFTVGSFWVESVYFIMKYKILKYLSIINYNLTSKPLWKGFFGRFVVCLYVCREVLNFYRWSGVSVILFLTPTTSNQKYGENNSIPGIRTSLIY